MSRSDRKHDQARRHQPARRRASLARERTRPVERPSGGRSDADDRLRAPDSRPDARRARRAGRSPPW
ncbi:MAG: hypothetical protein C0481_08725 [Phenylobacterium sp.]|nr:hypothetical protein [Phenylobacterium sp.]